MSAREGLAVLRQQFGSLERYGAGTGAFLAPLYGCGELPQAFCRVAAVAGAVYVLKQPIKAICQDSQTEACTAVELDTGQHKLSRQHALT
eukprot:jgi/Astpho2/1811/Aster-x0075